MIKKEIPFVHPVILSACICAFLLYTNAVPLGKRNAYKSILPAQSVTAIYGLLETPLCISGSSKIYSTSVKLHVVRGVLPYMPARNFSMENNAFSAAGAIPVSIPASFVETYSPGRLSSLAKKSFLIEKGAYIQAEGIWSETKGSFVIKEISDCHFSNTLLGRIAHLRAISRLLFKRLMYSWGSAGALVLSLLSGSREYLSDSVRDYFKDAGLSHILALSGMHLSFFSGLATKAGRKLFGKKYIYIPQLISVLLFFWFAGISPSLLRALICSLFLLTASLICHKNIDMAAVLSAAFLIHISLLPQDMHSAAFMLSYAALGGIVLLSSIFAKPLSLAFGPATTNALSSSISAQIATSGISVSLFGKLMPIGIVASMIVSPLITLFLTSAIVFIVIALCIPFLSPVFSGILSLQYKVIIFFVELFSKVPPITC